MSTASDLSIGFSIKTHVFEGPLELLLELVEKHKLLINDISLAEVTDEYMATVSQMQEQSLPNTVQFVQLAATLLLIKSKSLLPVLELTPEEEDSVDDLELRLKRYAFFRDIGQQLAVNFGQKISHEKRYAPVLTPLFVTDSYTTLPALHTAMIEVILNLPKKIIRPQVRVRPVISLEEMIDKLHQRIESQLRLQFSDLVPNNKEKVLLIVGFLAVLEAVKQGSVQAEQTIKFADFAIFRPEQIDIPNY